MADDLKHLAFCTICSCEFDPTQEGVVGDIGIIRVAFCGTCRCGVVHFVQTYCCNREIGCAVDEEELVEQQLDMLGGPVCQPADEEPIEIPRFLRRGDD